MNVSGSESLFYIDKWIHYHICVVAVSFRSWILCSLLLFGGKTPGRYSTEISSSNWMSLTVILMSNLYTFKCSPKYLALDIIAIQRPYTLIISLSDQHSYQSILPAHILFIFSLLMNLHRIWPSRLTGICHYVPKVNRKQ